MLFLTVTLLPLKLDSMQVRVLYFGVLKELLSSNGEAVILPEGARVAQRMERLRKGVTHPVWSAHAVNREYSAASAVQHGGDEVALLPPVSGGMDSAGAASVVTPMVALTREAAERCAIDRVGRVHRLGRLEIGQSSIVIVVTSAHRAAAFDACRWLIDTLKRTVPVWKKEHFADGAVWTDGEPFPAQLQLGSSA